MKFLKVIWKVNLSQRPYCVIDCVVDFRSELGMIEDWFEEKALEQIYFTFKNYNNQLTISNKSYAPCGIVYTVEKTPTIVTVKNMEGKPIVELSYTKGGAE